MAAENAPEKIDIFDILSRFLNVFKKLWILVLVLTLALSGLNCLRSRRNFVPYYESKAIFSVISGYGADDIFTNSYYYDMDAANYLVTSFPSVLSTDMMRDLILVNLDKGWINGSITASCVAQTNLFELTVRSNNSQDAYDILCAVIEAYPQVMVYTTDTPQLIMRQEAQVPTSPINHFDPVRAFVKGGILGLVGGMLLVLAVTLLIRTVNTPKDLKKLVNLPLIATIPHVHLKKRRKSSVDFITSADDPGLAESIRGLRTKLIKQSSAQEKNVILFTSTLPGEGKSTITLNLALSLISDGKKVVLIDADLRNQSIHRMLKLKPGKSLMDCLTNRKLDVMDQLVRFRGSNLYCLSGESISKRHYNIDGAALDRILETLSEEFDYVLLDSAPCSIVSDTALIARHADAVIYVVKQNYASKSQILDAVSALHDRDIPLGGTIINIWNNVYMQICNYSFQATTDLSHISSI